MAQLIKTKMEDKPLNLIFENKLNTNHLKINKLIKYKPPKNKQNENRRK